MMSTIPLSRVAIAWPSTKTNGTLYSRLSSVLSMYLLYYRVGSLLAFEEERPALAIEIIIRVLYNLRNDS